MLNTPFTEGREANTYLLDSIEAKLRAESGAAVPETEVSRAGKRFRPSPLDSDKGVKIKADLLADFLEGAFNKTQRDGRFDLDGTLKNVEAAAAARLNDVGTIDTSKIDGFDAQSPEDQKRILEHLQQKQLNGEL
jgi:hypothetical protein